MRYCIGIEGVGMRHSVGVLSNSEGRILAAARIKNEPMSLHTLPPLILQTRLGRLIHGLVTRARLSTQHLVDCSLCIGLTGVTFRYDREIVLREIIEAMDLEIGNLICTGDVEIVFSSHAQRSTGSAILCHSGSTAYALATKDGVIQHFRYGGWGPVLGDEGSGFAMGKAALRAIGQEHDQRMAKPSKLWWYVDNWLRSPQPPLPLWQAASARWKIMCSRLNRTESPSSAEIDPRELIFYFAHDMQQHGLTAEPKDADGIEAWRRIVSGLVIPLIQAWRATDQQANHIVTTALDDLTRQYKAACEIARAALGSLFDPNPVVLYGGVIMHNADFAEALMSRVSEINGGACQFLLRDSPGVMRPACGALLFALGGSETGRLRLPPPQVIRSVYNSHLHPVFTAELLND